MKRTLCLLALAALTFSAVPVSAQQVGENINVLPIFPDPNDPEFFLKGDGYLQRQLEPTICASTRNPNNLIAFFNDYRAVDEPGGSIPNQNYAVAMAMTIMRTLMAAVLGPVFPTMPPPLPVAAAEAWVGMSRSYDGGLTWSGGFLPGAPFDGSPASLASPVYGLEAATDPVVVCGPCGKAYVIFVAFTRGGQSKIAVARYEDFNNVEGGDTWEYLGTTVLESGNNAEFGYFLDKPDLAVDVVRDESAGECAQRVMGTYTTFNGLTKEGKFQSKVNFAQSVDYGMTYSTTKINKTWGQGQGTSIAIDPRTGTPEKDYGPGTIYVTWRHFFDPDTILMTKSTDYGVKWSAPVSIIGSVPMAAYDQPTIPTDAFGDPAVYGEPATTTFRSNGFPTSVVDANGRLYVAWQERVDHLGNYQPVSGSGGSPRIVMLSTADGGANWENTDGLIGYRAAVDFGLRDKPFNVGLPGPWPVVPDGPQVMPELSFAGGNLMLAYYESRGLVDLIENPTPPFTPYRNGAEDIEYLYDLTGVVPGFISGYQRVLDLRAALLDPSDYGSLESSVQVSRYPIRVGADLSDGQQLVDVAPVNPPCSPDYDADPLYAGQILPPCVRQVNRANAPTSAAGTSAFIGDYTFLAPFLQFVPDQNEPSGWRWAAEPADLPSSGFHAIWADNRHLIPPVELDGNVFTEWLGFPNYDPPDSGQLSCQNAGSRNTDVLTSRVGAGLVLSAPINYKDVRFLPATFPFTVSNRTNQTRLYQVSIASNQDRASFASNPPGVFSGQVEIFPYSSASLVVYASPPGDVVPIRIEVTEIPPCVDTTCQVASITFNADLNIGVPVQAQGEDEFSQAAFEGDAFVFNSSGENAFVFNETEQTAFVFNPQLETAFVFNAFVFNAFVFNAFVFNTPPVEIIDTTWTISPGESTTASTFLAIPNIDNAEQFYDDYAFQMIIHKGSLHGGLNECGAVNVNEPQILSTISQPAGVDPENAFVFNPTPENAFVFNAFPENAFVFNSTFVMAPSDAPAASGTKSLTVSDTNDKTTKAPRATDEVYVTLRAFRVTPYPEETATTKALADEPLCKFETDEFIYNPAIDPPSLAVVATTCSDPNCVEFDAPDLWATGLHLDYGEFDGESSDILFADVGVNVEACQPFNLPVDGWLLTNRGTSAATAENRCLRHAVLLCDASVVTSAEREGADLPLDLSQCELLAPDTGATTADFSLDPGFSEPFPEFTGLVIREEIPSNEKYVVLAQDYLLEVSEVNEVNNTIVFPTTVNPYAGPTYGFEGSSEPLVYDGPEYVVNAGSTVPLTWQYLDPDTGEPIYSEWAEPVIRITPFDCATEEEAPELSFILDPGNSDYRYFNGSDSHRFNWQTKELEIGCFNIRVEARGMCQTDGPFPMRLQ
jgi:hypothetical protein